MHLEIKNLQKRNQNMPGCSLRKCVLTRMELTHTNCHGMPRSASFPSFPPTTISSIHSSWSVHTPAPLSFTIYPSLHLSSTHTSLRPANPYSFIHTYIFLAISLPHYFSPFFFHHPSIHICFPQALLADPPTRAARPSLLCKAQSSC